MRVEVEVQTQAYTQKRWRGTVPLGSLVRGIVHTIGDARSAQATLHMLWRSPLTAEVMHIQRPAYILCCLDCKPLTAFSSGVLLQLVMGREEYSKIGSKTFTDLSSRGHLVELQANPGLTKALILHGRRAASKSHFMVMPRGSAGPVEGVARWGDILPVF